MTDRILTLTAENFRRAHAFPDSAFFKAYAGLWSDDPKGRDEQALVLRAAALFLRVEDPVLNQLGYRITIRNAVVYGDFKPLLDVAVAKGYVPLVRSLIGRSSRWRNEFGETLLNSLVAAFGTSRGDHTIYETVGQRRLSLEASVEGTRLFVAPTSYGKSELLADRVFTMGGSLAVVIVPTRALISQTRNRLARDPRLDRGTTRLITHNDAFVPDRSTIAVLTQERFMRLLIDNPGVAATHVLVDEAHNLFDGEDRASELLRALIITRARNPRVVFSYFSPFVANAESLADRLSLETPDSVRVSEYLKSEQYFCLDLGDRLLQVYDQFLRMPIGVRSVPFQTELEAVEGLSKSKNLVYAATPRRTEQLAAAFSRRRSTDVSEAVVEAAKAIEELTDPDYSLVSNLASGVMFHHGRVPDFIREYIERLFADRDSGVSHVFCTSTLLEGVNTPADALFILRPNKRGNSHLTRSEFRNLAGRVNRFGDIFRPDADILDGIQPPVYVIKGESAPETFDLHKFMEKVSRLDRPLDDTVKNALLVRAEAGDDAIKSALEHVVNIDAGAAPPSPIALRRAALPVGRSMYEHGILDIDIPEEEHDITHALSTTYGPAEGQLARSAEVVRVVAEVFLTRASLKTRDPLLRLVENEKAREFYSMFLDWRRSALPLRVMLRRFLDYWQSLTDPVIWVGASWGEIKRDTTAEHAPQYVDLRKKSRRERVNLAIARIQDESNFVNHRLMRYVEVLHDLGYVGERAYNELRYGTSDNFMVALLKLGVSIELSRRLRDDYREFVRSESLAGTVQLATGLSSAMKRGDENEVLVFEASNWEEH